MTQIMSNSFVTQSKSDSTVTAALLLLHAPAFFEFRDRGDIYFPYLSTSGDVPITPLYEYFPIGFKSLHRYLTDRGHNVKIMNLATVFVKYPSLDVRALLLSLNARIFGIDLHWMVHVQGSLEIARILNMIHPDVPIIFGGISSTYYATQLIQYPFVDMVMRGYDTHEPMSQLMALLTSTRNFGSVPNLVWKDGSGDVADNGYTHKPDSFSCGTDWSHIPRQQSDQSLPILEILSTQNAGCTHNCGWCGGSSDAFERIHGLSDRTPRKSLAEIAYEFSTMKSIAGQYHFYSVGS